MKTYKNLQLNYDTDPFATHQPVLLWAAENTSGDMLELGCGDNSTQLLRSFLINSNRKLVSVESEKDWYEKYKNLEQENHKIILTENWNNTIDMLAEKTDWGLVFIDQWPYDARRYSFYKLLDKCDYIVAHDSDDFPEYKKSDYNWIEFIPVNQPMPHRSGPPSYLLSKKHSLNNINILQ